MEASHSRLSSKTPKGSDTAAGDITSPGGGAANTVAGGMPIPVTYTSEEAAFHKSFPFVPLSEKLVDHYQCSVVRSKVVRLGRLYLTAVRLCFLSSFLKEPLHIPWDAVQGVDRKSNFLFELIVVKRTAEAVRAQQQQHSNGGGSSTRASANTNQPGDRDLGSGGVGDDESFTGFVYGSSDGAFRMMKMLWSVRSRYLSGSQDVTPSAGSPVSQGLLNDSDAFGTKSPSMSQSRLSDGTANHRRSVSQQLFVPEPQRAVSATGGGARSAPGSGNPSFGEEAAAMEPLDSTLRGDPLHDPGDDDAPAGILAAMAVTAPPPVEDSEACGPEPAAEGDAFGDEGTPRGTAGRHGPTPQRSPENDPDAVEMRDVNSPRDSTTGSPALGAKKSSSNGNGSFVLLENPQRAMLTDEQRRKLDSKGSGGGGSAGDAANNSSNANSASASASASANNRSGLRASTSAKAPRSLAAVAAADESRDGGDGSHGPTGYESVLKGFPMVPRSEVIVDQFQCSFVSGMHRLGKLYLTANYMLFTSPFLSETVTIRLIDIERIERLQTILVLDGINVHLRPEAAALVVGDALKAGPSMPAGAITYGISAAQIAAHVAGGAAEGSSPPSSMPTSPSQQPADSAAARSPESDATEAPQAVTPRILEGGAPNHPLANNRSNLYSRTSYTFTSFVGSRDAAYNIILHFCRSHNTAVENAKPLVGAAEAQRAAETAKQEKAKRDAEAAAAAATASAAGAAAAGAPAADGGSSAPAASGGSGGGGVRSWKAFKTAQATRHYDKGFITVKGLDDLDGLATDFGTGLSNVCHLLKGRVLIDPVVMPAGMDLFDVFYHAFDDDTTLLAGYHAGRQDTGMVWTPWTAPAKPFAPLAGEAATTGAGQRSMSCKTIVRALGATVCDFNEYHRFAFVRIPGADGARDRRLLMVQLSGQAIGAMFSDAFRAETLMLFEEELVPGGSSDSSGGDGVEEGENPQRAAVRVRMSCFGYIQFLKSVWVKGRIESAALGTEMPECYRRLSKIIVERLTTVLRQEGGTTAAPQSPQAAATTGATAAAATAGTGAATGSSSVDVGGEGDDASAGQPASAAAGGAGAGQVLAWLRPASLLRAAGPSPPLWLLALAAYPVVLCVWWSACALLALWWYPSLSTASTLAPEPFTATAPTLPAGADASTVAAVNAAFAALVAQQQQQPSTGAFAAGLSDLYSLVLRPLAFVLHALLLAATSAVAADYALAIKKAAGM